MDSTKLISMIKKQLAEEFNCKESDFDNGKIVVTEKGKCGAVADKNSAMNVCCFGGNTVISVLPDMVSDFTRVFANQDPDYIFKQSSIIKFSELLYLHGENMDDMTQYYVPNPSFEKAPDCGFDIESSDCSVTVSSGNAKASAKAESGVLWGVALECDDYLLAPKLLSVLKEEVLSKGYIPFIRSNDRSISASVKSGAGFVPLFTAIVSRPRTDEFVHLHERQ